MRCRILVGLCMQTEPNDFLESLSRRVRTSLQGGHLTDPLGTRGALQKSGSLTGINVVLKENTQTEGL